jgi:hypothetical protein
MPVPSRVGPVPVNGKTITGAVVVALLAIGGACSSNSGSGTPRALSTPITVTVTVPVYPSPTAVSLPAPSPAPVAAAPRTTVPAARPIPLADPDPEPVVAPPAAAVYYKNCAAVQAAGAAPIRRGDPGYRPALDRDGDGEGCAGD